jgi:hypothetical protein
MYNKHQNVSDGDMSFIEAHLPDSVKVFHMDSYNIDDRKRFQGSFIYDFGGRLSACNEAPLEVLNQCKRYSVRICTCKEVPHLVWTIWF